MKKILFVFASIVLLGLAGSTAFVVYTANQPDGSIEATTNSAEAETPPPTPEELLRLVNDERAKVGVAPLVIDENVQKAAQLKADDFASRDYYSHAIKGSEYILTPEMDSLISTMCTTGNENINNNIQTSAQAVSSWINSPSHKETMLNAKYSKTGFGVSHDEGKYYFTVQHFCVAK